MPEELQTEPGVSWPQTVGILRGRGRGRARVRVRVRVSVSVSVRVRVRVRVRVTAHVSWMAKSPNHSSLTKVSGCAAEG